MNRTPPKIIIISGPTATGKTKISIDLINDLKKDHPQLKASIVNFDSLLFYQELNIGTCKPSSQERKNIPHYLIDITSIDRPIDAALFAQQAKKIIEELLKDSHLVFLVGGSGFYLKALVEGMYASATTSKEIRERSETLYHQEGIKPFWDFLKDNDSEMIEKLHPNDHYRIRRAVEHFWQNQTLFSLVKKQLEASKVKTNNNPNSWQLYHCYLNIPKEQHQQIIIKRTESMFAQGLQEEVQEILNRGFSGIERPLQSIGYKEMIDFLSKKILTLPDCKERINISTRQLAKSQRTWFKKIQDKKEYNPLTDYQLIYQDIKTFLQIE